MSKILVAVAAAAVLLAQPAFAKMDCGANLSKYSTMIGQMDGAAKKRVSMHRMLVKAYDSCEAGDEFTAKKFFAMLEKNSVR